MLTVRTDTKGGSMIVKDVVVTQEYRDSDHELKKKYIKIGVQMTYDDGGQQIVLSSIPINWNGKATIYDKKDK
jgi:hypothetical protein